MRRLFLAAAVIASFAASAAGGHAKETEIIEAEGMGHTPYQNTLPFCTGTDSVCTLHFSAIPKNKRLVVVNASCGFWLAHPSAVNIVSFSATTGTTPFHYLPIQYTAPGANTDFYTFDAQTTAVFDAHQIPEIVIVTSTSVAFEGGHCSLTGYYVTP